MYKIPGRSIYCDTLSGWIKEMIWIYIVRKIFSSNIDAISCHCGIAPDGD